MDKGRRYLWGVVMICDNRSQRKAKSPATTGLFAFIASASLCFCLTKTVDYPDGLILQIHPDKVFDLFVGKRIHFALFSALFSLFSPAPF